MRNLTFDKIESVFLCNSNVKYLTLSFWILKFVLGSPGKMLIRKKRGAKRRYPSKIRMRIFWNQNNAPNPHHLRYFKNLNLLSKSFFLKNLPWSGTPVRATICNSDFFFYFNLVKLHYITKKSNAIQKRIPYQKYNFGILFTVAPRYYYQGYSSFLEYLKLKNILLFILNVQFFLSLFKF